MGTLLNFEYREQIYREQIIYRINVIMNNIDEYDQDI